MERERAAGERATARRIAAGLVAMVGCGTSPEPPIDDTSSTGVAASTGTPPSTSTSLDPATTTTSGSSTTVAVDETTASSSDDGTTTGPPGCNPNVVLMGYWPPTNEMLRPWSQNPEQNPDGWIGEGWEGYGYDVVSFFPEFPPDGDPNDNPIGGDGAVGHAAHDDGGHAAGRDLGARARRQRHRREAQRVDHRPDPARWPPGGQHECRPGRNGGTHRGAGAFGDALLVVQQGAVDVRGDHGGQHHCRPARLR